MFESAVSPVVRLAAVLPPAGRSARRLAAARALPPGAEAMRLLAGVDPDALDDADRVDHLVAWERCARWVEAQRARAVVAVAGPAPADRDDFDREFVRVALVDCGGSARASVDLARALAGRLRAARDALERGEISYAHARILAEETAELTDPAAAAVATRTLARGPRRTPAEFRRAVRRAVLTADPIRAELAAARAGAQRGVSTRALPDAQAALCLTGPALDVASIWTALTAHAARPAADEDRTLDQRRFDALVAICRAALTRPDTPAGRAGVPPTVYLFADLPTWLGLADHPVDLDGYGPVPAGVARAHLDHSRWRALVTDAVTGAVRAVGDRSYRPSARTTRALHARDRRCGFPGCAATIAFCDADHNHPHDRGGDTDPDNCGLFCRRHHRLKTFTPWSWRRGPDGAIEWIDPHGQTWSREPIRYHLPDPEPDPEADPEPEPGPGSATRASAPDDHPGDPPF